jgi:hypothetical protein
MIRTGRPDPQRGSKHVNKPQSIGVHEVDWFSEHAHLWEQHLGSRFSGTARVNALLVGAYEGLAAKWLLENALTHATSRLTVVDPFDYPACVQYLGRGVCNPRDKVRRTFDAMVAQHEHMSGESDAKVRVLDDVPAWRALMRLGGGGAKAFDLVCVDLGQSAAEVLELLVLSYRMLKPGGILVVTNYTNAPEHDARCPRRGIDAFTDAYAYEVRVLQTAWHTFLQRRAKPLLRPGCLSENYQPHPPEGRCPNECK